MTDEMLFQCQRLMREYRAAEERQAPHTLGALADRITVTAALHLAPIYERRLNDLLLPPEERVERVTDLFQNDALFAQLVQSMTSTVMRSFELYYQRDATPDYHRSRIWHEDAASKFAERSHETSGAVSDAYSALWEAHNQMAIALREIALREDSDAS